jgi:hypothetical protein
MCGSGAERVGLRSTKECADWWSWERRFCGNHEPVSGWSTVWPTLHDRFCRRLLQFSKDNFFSRREALWRRWQWRRGGRVSKLEGRACLRSRQHSPRLIEIGTVLGIKGAQLHHRQLQYAVASITDEFYSRRAHRACRPNFRDLFAFANAGDTCGSGNAGREPTSSEKLSINQENPDRCSTYVVWSPHRSRRCSHFARDFKSKYGLTPGEHRAKAYESLGDLTGRGHGMGRA